MYYRHRGSVFTGKVQPVDDAGPSIFTSPPEYNPQWGRERRAARRDNPARRVLAQTCRRRPSDRR